MKILCAGLAFVVTLSLASAASAACTKAEEDAQATVIDLYVDAFNSRDFRKVSGHIAAKFKRTTAQTEIEGASGLKTFLENAGTAKGGFAVEAKAVKVKHTCDSALAATVKWRPTGKLKKKGDIGAERWTSKIAFEDDGGVLKIKSEKIQ